MALLPECSFGDKALLRGLFFIIRMAQNSKWGHKRSAASDPWSVGEFSCLPAQLVLGCASLHRPAALKAQRDGRLRRLTIPR